MKIAIILPSLANKAPIHVAKNIIHEVQKINCDVEFVVYYFDKIESVAINAKCCNISIFDRIDFSDFDIIHTHGIRPDAYVWLNRSRIRGVVISTVHSYIGKELKSSYNCFIATLAFNIWIFFLRRNDKVVVLSRDMKKYFAKLISNDKLVSIYNGLTIPKIDVEEGRVDGDVLKILELQKKFIILGANALVSRIKGLDQVIEFLYHYDKNKLYCFVLAGDGRLLPELKEKVKLYSLQDRVFFMGFKTNVFDYLNIYDIYLMPSRSEGFPLAMIEAAAYKKVIVCSDIKVFREIFSSNEVVFFELENIASLAFAIDLAVSQRMDLAHNIFDKYSISYTGDIMGREYLYLYKAILENPAH